MTLQRFLEGMGGGRWAWPVRCAGIALKPDQRMPWLAAGIQVAGGALYGLLLGWLLSLIPTHEMIGKPIRMTAMLGTLGLTFGAVSQAMVMVAWNRRARALRRAGLAEPPPRPRRRWWQTWLVAPFYVVVCLGVTSVALWAALDGAIANAAWQRTRAALVARGEPMTIQELVPAMPPDDQNFWRTPLLRSANEYALVESNGLTQIVWADPVGRHRAEAMWLPNPVFRENAKPKRRGAVVERRPEALRLDLDGYARGIRAKPVETWAQDRGAAVDAALLSRYGLKDGPPSTAPEKVLPDEIMRRYGLVRTNVPRMNPELVQALVIEDPAREVLEFLKRYEPELTEVASAAQRPFSAYPLKWDAGADLHLTHLAFAKKLSTMFRVRSAARLASGDTNGAHADVVTMLRLSERSAPEPVLISLLVRIAQTATAVSAVTEGWLERRWTDAQWSQLQEMLIARDLQAEGIRAFQGERVFGTLQLEGLLQPPPRLFSSPARIVTPSGFLRWNMVAQNRALDVVLAKFRDPSWCRDIPRRFSVAAVVAEAGLEPKTPHNVLAAMLVPAYEKTPAKLARQVTMLRLAGVACALERHRLKHGTFPVSLAELSPGFFGNVPLDPMSGREFLYERSEPGNCRLWSVGLNGRDDGGIYLSEGNDENGDWVWADVSR